MASLFRVSDDLPEEDEALSPAFRRTPGKTSSLFQKEDIDEEDEEIDVTAAVAIESKPVQAASQECLDASQRIALHPWDVTAWKVFLDEAKAGRGGTVSPVEGFKRFLDKFPRAYRVWKDFAEYYISKGLEREAESVFDNIKTKSRDIEVWRSYIALCKQKLVRTYGTKLPLSYFESLRKEYEKAVDNAGMSVDSYPLWRDYIDFGKEEFETTKNIEFLRQIYWKSLVVPMEGLDYIWKEYEAWERFYAEPPEKISQDYLHAKAVYKQRRKLSHQIDFTRLAVPPTNSLEETVQLERWNNWICDEREKNYDKHSPIRFQAFIKMLYEQCLRSLMYFPEVWLSLAQFEFDNGESMEAISIYEQAKDILPQSMLIRIALSETQERMGKMEDAKKTLRIAAFQDIKSGFAFSVYQRFVRRTEGINAGRKLFSDSMKMRSEDKKLAFEICLAHAQTELDTNCNAEVCLTVLDMARTANALAVINVPFVKLRLRALVRLGDLKQLRWFMEDSIQNLSSVIASQTIVAQSNATTAALDNETLIGVGGSVDLAAALRNKLILCDEYLFAETLIGLSDTDRLNQLRLIRDEARMALETHERSRNASNNVDSFATRRFEIANSSTDLSDRYGIFASDLPITDASVRERSNLKKLVKTLTKKQDNQASLRDFGSQSTAKLQQSLENMSELTNVPKVLKDFLFELPNYSGATPDIDHCMSMFSRIVLPPRPEEDFTKSVRKDDDDNDEEVEDKTEDEFRKRRRLLF